MSMITLDMDRPYISLLEMTKIQLSCFLLAISLVGIHTMYVCIVFGRNKPYVYQPMWPVENDSAVFCRFVDNNKTIGDEGITVDFRFIKVHTSN